MTDLSPEEKEKIYAEEKARIEARDKIKAEAEEIIIPEGWKRQDIQITKLTKQGRQEELERLKPRMTTEGWEFITYIDKGLWSRDTSKAVFKKKIVEEEPRPTKSDPMKRFMEFVNKPWVWKSALVFFIVVIALIGAFTYEDPKCPPCEGFGYLSGACRFCGGTGEYYRGDYHVGICQHCHGTGQGKCNLCNGTGKRK